MLRLAAIVEQLWLAGNITEGRRWLGEALAGAPKPTSHRIQALNAAAALATFQQDHEEAHRLLTESLALATELDDGAGEAWAWLWLGWLEENNDPPKSDALRRSLELHEQLGDSVGVCRSLVFLGAVLSQYPESMNEGQVLLRRALAMAHELDDGWSGGLARFFLGVAEVALGNHELAVAHLAYAIRTPALGPVRGTALEGLARVELERDPRRALRLVGACAAVRERGGGRPPAWLKRRGEAVRAEAEQVLGKAEAQQVWEEGRRMSTEQAITYALEHTTAPTTV
jgi:tetratricopeptide (TPR) repeat protein